MSRVIDADVRAGLEAEDSPDALLAFITIAHPLLPDPIRAVSDVMDYLVDGNLFVGVPFDFLLPTDGEGPPITEIQVQNVDGRISRALLGLDSARATVSLEIRSSADFDLSQDPRVEPGGGSVIYGFSGFDLIDVSGDSVSIKGRVMLRDYSQEPWPGLRCTQSRVPGLFR